MTGHPLLGKTAFVSGSGKNIGRAIALQLAALGCNVVVNGARDQAGCEKTAAGVTAAGAQALVAMGDVAKPDDVARMIDAAQARFGGIDILVNNAAIRPHKPFLETTDADWDGVMDTALTAAFRLSRAVLPHMVAAKWGRIVNFAGMKAMRGYFEGAPISAAKHGVLGYDQGAVARVRNAWDHGQYRLARSDPQRDRNAGRSRTGQIHPGRGDGPAG